MVCGLPCPHLRHLVRHLAQGLGCAHNISALFASTQFSNLPGFIEDLADGLLACIPCKHNKVRHATNVTRHPLVIGRSTS